MVADIADAAVRTAALDPSRSFIVQAPAGSGKTELLIRRYLRLLATVDEPEQIIAITFTRKAAAEMRHRIMAALRSADVDGEDTPLPPHQAATRQLAVAALKRSAQRDWSLADSPQRMRIETLDALNGWLARRLPVLAAGAAGVRVTDKAQALYAEAARRTVGDLGSHEEPDASLQVLLGVLDNDVMQLEQMLADLLPRREQWLPYLAGSSDAVLRSALEEALLRLVREKLDETRALMPTAMQDELAFVLRHAAEHADDAHQALFAAWCIRAGHAAADAPSQTFESFATLDMWKAAAELLLTQKNEWRKRLNKTFGFGPIHPVERDRANALLASLEGDDALLARLTIVRYLPAPYYSDTQWQTLAALRVVLIHAVAELRLLFSERQNIDFVEVALAARQALGQTDSPSDLLLALDRRIQHLLVDEFQDTSHPQLRLLELLTAGWQREDGRTLFLVGDPMQSIYRFREADVSLFLRVQQRGIGEVRCEPLTLECNFRSRPEVVDWINNTFAGLFPPEDNLGAGEAKFAASIACRDAAGESAVHIHPLQTDDVNEELATTTALIEQTLASSAEATIGVLVQSRTHLAGLHAHLRMKGLAVHAVEIDSLSAHQVVQDLLGLTRALTHPADRIAWLAVLRAPWCGMRWDDLAELCADEHALTLGELMQDPERVARLSEDGRERMGWLQHVIADATSHREAQPFADWVRGTWQTLGGPDCLDTADEHAFARDYFTALAQVSRDGDIDDPAVLESAVAKSHARTQAPPDTRVEIMTIHRAKGLEFDTVILLGLGRTPRPDSRKALNFMQRVASDGTEELILAPLAGPEEDDTLVKFVGRTDKQRAHAERTRLLYVATTRARERLHLVCRLGGNKEEPTERTFLRRLWPQVAHRFAEGAQDTTKTKAAKEGFRPVLRRFADGFESRAPADPCAGADQASPERTGSSQQPARPEFEWARQSAIHIGTLVHRWLQRMAETGLEAWTEQRILGIGPTIKGDLTILGIDQDEVAEAAARVSEALLQVFRDPQGRWLLEDHPDARSELRLTLYNNGALEHIQLDRTFVADGVRWIIDFKTSSHEGAEIEAFLDSEVRRYRPQLERYARAMTTLDPATPVRAGLYFPLLQAFRSWTPDTQVSQG